MKNETKKILALVIFGTLALLAIKSLISTFTVISTYMSFASGLYVGNVRLLESVGEVLCFIATLVPFLKTLKVQQLKTKRFFLVLLYIDGYVMSVFWTMLNGGNVTLYLWLVIYCAAYIFAIKNMPSSVDVDEAKKEAEKALAAEEVKQDNEYYKDLLDKGIITQEEYEVIEKE